MHKLPPLTIRRLSSARRRETSSPFVRRHNKTVRGQRREIEGDRETRTERDGGEEREKVVVGF